MLSNSTQVLYPRTCAKSFIKIYASVWLLSSHKQTFGFLLSLSHADSNSCIKKYLFNIYILTERNLYHTLLLSTFTLTFPRGLGHLNLFLGRVRFAKPLLSAFNLRLMFPYLFFPHIFLLETQFKQTKPQIDICFMNKRLKVEGNVRLQIVVSYISDEFRCQSSCVYNGDSA